ncbi:hypothetical protein C8F04DRAFT_650243 [Mycena alexandri]|uniref:F-box domain-containing protein n=1 Tax=Mycena alexandri TaxID=1745969 RepID=A0AAD6SS09_9AGAR|nr:hypothetical protein C8F04DRAFT_650243 [Mycena alexandri]
MAISCDSCGFISETHPSIFPGLHHLLETNDPPRDSDVPILRASILESRRHIAPLDIKINRVQCSLDLGNLVEERDELMARLVHCTAVVSSVRNVPPEILSQIFMATIRNQDPRTEIHTRWTVTLVCRNWRSVALNLPARSPRPHHTRSTTNSMRNLKSGRPSSPLSLTRGENSKTRRSTKSRNRLSSSWVAGTRSTP